MVFINPVSYSSFKRNRRKLGNAGQRHFDRSWAVLEKKAEFVSGKPADLLQLGRNHAGHTAYIRIFLVSVSGVAVSIRRETIQLRIPGSWGGVCQIET